MKDINVIFFGSTGDSLIVLDKLAPLSAARYRLVIAAVVTQPPRPVGRNHTVTPTPTEAWAKEHGVTALSFPSDPTKSWLYEDEQTVIDTLAPFGADLLISASYGQLIPTPTISSAQYGGLNVHPSLLPRWRGADPVPWTILAGDRQTGITIVTLSKEFDEGKIIAQKKIPVNDNDETDPLRARLFSLGAQLLAETVSDYLSGVSRGASQQATQASYARRLTRDDGYIPWEILQAAVSGTDVPPDKRPALLSLDQSHVSITIPKAIRALTPWPGVWTEIATQARQVNSRTEKKRLKIHACHTEQVTNKLILDSVQLEGKNPVSYSQFAGAYHIPPNST